MKLKVLATSVLLATSMQLWAEEEKAPVMATVNGEAISQRAVDSFIQHRRMQPTPETRAKVLDELINIELLAQDAKKNNLQESAEVKETLAALKKQVLAQARIKELSKAGANEDALKAAYEEKYQGSGASEYNARHILVKTEDEAKAIIAELDKGGDFVALAKEKSTGPSGANGGDLGWFGGDQMVKPFSEAVAKMEKGKYSSTPVKTQFGWHIIKLEDTRKSEPPAFADVKTDLERAVHNDGIDSLLKNLRESAKIEMK